MNYIKKIFNNEIEESIHKNFIRYSVGLFQGPMITFKKTTSQKLTIRTSYHFLKDFLKLIPKFSNLEKIHIKGKIIHNESLNSLFEELGNTYSNVRNIKGIYTYEFEFEAETEKFCKLFCNYNLIIEIKNDKFHLKTKNTMPKINKSFEANFLKFKFNKKDIEIIEKDFLFGIEKDKKYKKIAISHEINIEKIVLPKNKKLHFDEIRKLSKRKGTLKRIMIFNDDKKNKNETICEFLI